MKVFYKQIQLNPSAGDHFSDVDNKPLINSIELLGDKSTEQARITWFGTQEEFDALGSYSNYIFYIIDDGIPVGKQDDYLDLANKPSINGQVLTGNKLSSDLNMYNTDEIDNMLASLRSIKVVATLPSTPVANTMYYVGPDSEGVYMVYLYDTLLNRIDLGPSVQKLYTPGVAIQVDNDTDVIDVKVDDDTITVDSNNQLYVVDATDTQKGTIKYDNIFIGKNLSDDLEVKLNTMYPVGTEIKLYNTSFNPSTAPWYNIGTWELVTADTDAIRTIFNFTKNDFSSSGNISLTTKIGTSVKLNYSLGGAAMRITEASKTLKTVKVIGNQSYSAAFTADHGLTGIASGSTIYSVSMGHKYNNGDTWPQINESFTAGSSDTWAHLSSLTYNLLKSYNAWEYTVQRFPASGNSVTVNGFIRSESPGYGANYSISASAVADGNTAVPMIYQNGATASALTGLNQTIIIYEKGDVNTYYKIWKRTA